MAPCLASLGGTVFSINQCVAGFIGMIHHIISYVTAPPVQVLLRSLVAVCLLVGHRWCQGHHLGPVWFMDHKTHHLPISVLHPLMSSPLLITAQLQFFF